MDEIRIKPYDPKYKDQIVKLFEDFYDYLVEIDPLRKLIRQPGYEENTTEQTLKDVTEKEGVFYVALDGDKVVGFTVGTIRRPTPEDLLGAEPSVNGRVTELYVDKDYRGKGLATKLMEKVEQTLKEKGCDYIWVEVFAPNQPPRSLYQKLGYIERDIDMIKKIS